MFIVSQHNSPKEMITLIKYKNYNVFYGIVNKIIKIKFV